MHSKQSKPPVIVQQLSTVEEENEEISTMAISSSKEEETKKERLGSISSLSSDKKNPSSNVLASSEETVESTDTIIKDLQTSISKLNSVSLAKIDSSEKASQLVLLVDQVLSRTLTTHQQLTKSAIESYIVELKAENQKSLEKQRQIDQLEKKIEQLLEAQKEQQQQYEQLDQRVKIAEKKINSKDIELGLIYHRLRKARTDLDEKDRMLQSLSVKSEDILNETSEEAIRVRNEKILLLEEKCAISEDVIAQALKQRADNEQHTGAKPFSAIPFIKGGDRDDVSRRKMVSTVSPGLAKPGNLYSSPSFHLSNPNSNSQSLPWSSLAEANVGNAKPRKLDIEAIIKEVRLNKIRDVEFTSDVDFTPMQLESFVNVLKLNSTVQFLSFTNMKLSEEYVNALADALKGHQNILTLSLEGCGLSVQSAQTILDILDHNATIVTLNFNNNLLNNESTNLWAKRISQLFGKNHPSLKRFCTGGTMLGPQGMKEVAVGLSINATLTSLDLSGNGLLKDGCARLAFALKNNRKLESLNLWGNLIGVEGAKSLSDVLKRNTVLRKLNLKGNNLREEGAKVIGEALLENQSISILDLSGNSFGHEGIQHLVKYIACTKCLSEIALGGNRIGNEGAALLGKAIKDNTSITYINLELNLIGNSGAKDLGIGLKTNQSVEQIDLSFNRIGLEGSIVLKKAIGKHLKQVDFVGNAMQNLNDLCKVDEKELEAIPEFVMEHNNLARKRVFSGASGPPKLNLKALSFGNLLNSALEPTGILSRTSESNEAIETEPPEVVLPPPPPSSSSTNE